MEKYSYDYQMKLVRRLSQTKSTIDNSKNSETDIQKNKKALSLSQKIFWQTALTIWRVSKVLGVEIDFITDNQNSFVNIANIVNNIQWWDFSILSVSNKSTIQKQTLWLQIWKEVQSQIQDLGIQLTYWTYFSKNKDKNYHWESKWNYQTKLSFVSQSQLLWLQISDLSNTQDMSIWLQFSKTNIEQQFLNNWIQIWVKNRLNQILWNWIQLSISWEWLQSQNNGLQYQKYSNWSQKQNAWIQFWNTISDEQIQNKWYQFSRYVDKHSTNWKHINLKKAS